METFNLFEGNDISKKYYLIFLRDFAYYKKIQIELHNTRNKQIIAIVLKIITNKDNFHYLMQMF